VLGGVGPKRAEALASLGIATVADLLAHYPRRYLDRTRQASLAELKVGEEAAVLAEVRRVTERRARRLQRPIVEVDVHDGSGLLRCTFFNQPWRAKQLSPGRSVVVFGRLESFQGRRRMTNPVVDLVGDRTGRIVPVYPQSDKAGLSSYEIQALVEEALRRAGSFADPLPDGIRRRLRLVSRDRALRDIHQPPSLPAAWDARRRLAFDELLRLQLLLVARKRATEREARGVRHAVGEDGGPLVAAFRRRLPFALTAAQERVLGEILADMAGPHPMHRLLQGDVGSGKTVVAAAALLAAVQGGYQGAFMAPTEVLAEQHHLGLRSLLEGLGLADPSRLTGERPVRLGLLTSRTPARQRARLHEGLRDGTVDLLVGTHALLTEEVGFRALGLVVIDEQHRFGVDQRARLREKGTAAAGVDPDVLVMTATPIPRTAAMTVYGDLDVSVLDERPAGRSPVRTVWAPGPEGAEEAFARVRAEAEAGRQAYVVCPLVEGSERVEARSATEEFERLEQGPLAGLRLGLLHGQMPPREKEAVMARFRAGLIDVLVATTVVEVGVDVPSASVIVIEDAQRFGMAQLHQLRGRVGRGEAPSFCFLLGEAGSEEAERRLRALEASTDGFELAEVDLELRGEGTILGTRQTGRSDLRLASLRRDKDLVLAARAVASELIDADPGLRELSLLAEELRVFLDEDDAAYLFKS
jgi:ATP-dependent DNA helicase RecG